MSDAQQRPFDRKLSALHKTPTGIGGLDDLTLGGLPAGRSTLLCGSANCGKTLFGITFLVKGATLYGESGVFISFEERQQDLSANFSSLGFDLDGLIAEKKLAFEESPDQLVRNMRSVGIDLAPHIAAGLLRFEAARPSLYGFEMHLARMNRTIEQFDPSLIVIDPISAFRGPSSDTHATLVRLADICKSRGITALFTSVSSASDTMNESEQSMSSLMDTWISLEDKEANGEHNRVLCLLKARGMDHSHQLREYRLTSHGIDLIEPYVGLEGVLTGSARLAQEAREREASSTAGRRPNAAAAKSPASVPRSSGKSWKCAQRSRPRKPKSPRLLSRKTSVRLRSGETVTRWR